MKDNKPWDEKVGIWIGIIAGLITIIVGIITIVNFKQESIQTNNIYDNTMTTNDGDIIFNFGDKYTLKEEALEDDSKIELLPEPTSSLKTEILNEEKTLQFDFGEAIRHIHSNEILIEEKIIYNNDNKPTYSSIYPGVKYSQILNKVRLIEVTKGFRDFGCSRIYHFDEDKKLTFALIEDEEGEHRLYFYDDTLIRYIDTNNNVHDINYGLENFKCKWTELALDESYEIFDDVKKSSDSNNDMLLYTEELESYSDDYIINWEDTTFEKLIKESLHKDTITYGDVKNIKSLYIFDYKMIIDEHLSYITIKAEDKVTTEFMSLNDLKYFDTLETLRIYECLSLNCDIFENTRCLTNLITLDVYSNLETFQIEQITNLKNLIDLHIHRSNLSDTDLKIISTMNNLTNLCVPSCNIKDILFVENMTNLKHLDISYNHISNIDVLKNLPNLESVYLYGNEITDFSPVSHVETVIKSIDEFEEK